MKKEIKIDGRKVIKTVGKGLQFAARIGTSKLTKDILSKAVSENISKNVFVQFGIYAVAGYAGSKASDFIGEKINEYIEIFEILDLYDNLNKNEEMEKENEKAN